MLVRRTALVIGLFVLAGALPMATPAAAAASCAVVGANPPVALVGSPKENIGSTVDAGLVHVVYETSSGEWTPSEQAIDESAFGVPPGSGARFGASSLIGYDNADGCPVLVIGAPGWNAGRGRVYVMKLTDGGPVNTVLEQGVSGVGGAAEPGDGFGSALAWDDSLDFRSWLAVGSPGEDIGSGSAALTDAGLVQIFAVSGAGAWGASDSSITQDTGAVPGSAEKGDRFGAALSVTADDSAGLVVGAPGEAIGPVAGAGAVTIIGAAANQFPLAGPHRAFNQESSGVPGSAEAGDGFGSSLAAGDIGSSGILVMGAPGEDIGSEKDAGSVTVAYPDGSYNAVSQGASGAEGSAEAGDRFGEAVLSIAYAVFVGAPGEDLGSVKDAGLVQTFLRPGGGAAVFPYKITGVDDFTTSENNSGVLGDPGTADAFGSSLIFATGNVWVGAPGESVNARAGAGGFYRFTFETTSFGYRDFTTQDSLGWDGTAESGDGFGAPIGYVGSFLS